MNIRVTTSPTERDTLEIYEMLKEYNLAKREKSENVPLGIFVEEDGRKLAGFIGEIFGNWLSIKYLFVGEPLRGQGVGRSLIERAETEAKARGAKYAFVDTFDFQAPGFYKKLGYREVFALTEYPYTGSRTYYTKEL